MDSSRGCEVYELAWEMTKRHASQPVDKLSGLLYLLRTTKLPCYDQKMTSEDFWRQSFHLLPAGQKIEILFNFPYRGSDQQWFPTWAQMLDWPERNSEYNHSRPNVSPDLIKNIPGETSFIINLYTIPNAVLKEGDNPDEYQVEIGKRVFGFHLPYLLQKPINIQGQPEFTLAIADLGDAHHNWVVCRPISNQVGADVGGIGVAEVNVLEKVGIIRTDFCSDLLVSGLLQKMDCLFV